MRIISGQAKGRRLKSPKGRNTRPTSDRVKEAIFNILNPYIPGCLFLDLYAGTGNIGIEALSRGSKASVFVENNSAALKVIHDNLALTGFENDAQVIRGSVISALEKFQNEDRKFDIIFLDPPYERDLSLPALQKINDNNLLAEDGMILLEHHQREKYPERIGRLFLTRQNKYGDTMISFYKIHFSNYCLEEEKNENCNLSR